MELEPPRPPLQSSEYVLLPTHNTSTFLVDGTPVGGIPMFPAIYPDDPANPRPEDELCDYLSLPKEASYTFGGAFFSSGYTLNVVGVHVDATYQLGRSIVLASYKEIEPEPSHGEYKYYYKTFSPDFDPKSAQGHIVTLLEKANTNPTSFLFRLFGTKLLKPANVKCPQKNIDAVIDKLLNHEPAPYKHIARRPKTIKATSPLSGTAQTVFFPLWGQHTPV